jgi:AcrR family transcriptional regulator
VPLQRPDLLTAARDALLEDGPRRMTLAGVARRAGVSRMTVYRQHSDLATLVSSVLTRELSQVLAEVEESVRPLPTGRERLVESAVLVVRGIVGHPVYRRILETDADVLLPLVVERFGTTQRAALALCEELVIAGQGDGSVRPLDPRLASTTVLMACQSFVFGARLVEEALVEELRPLLDGYLRA